MTNSIIKNVNKNSYANISNISLFVAASFNHITDSKSYAEQYDVKFEETTGLIRKLIT